METVNLGHVIELALARFYENRSGERPMVYVTIGAKASVFSWRDGKLKDLVRHFIYECLLSNAPDMPVEIHLRPRQGLRDLNAFVGVQPSYWMQLRLSGRGLKRDERAIEDLFASGGYRCEEWVGVENSVAMLGIFSAGKRRGGKAVICLERKRSTIKCDLLLPVYENPSAAAGAALGQELSAGGV